MPDEERSDRSGGIYVVRRSDFRIRDFRMSFDATSGELVDPGAPAATFRLPHVLPPSRTPLR